jgi:hypothetical protein
MPSCFAKFTMKNIFLTALLLISSGMRIFANQFLSTFPLLIAVQIGGSSSLGCPIARMK